MEEELGIQAQPEDLQEFGVQYKDYEGEFYGKPFRDRQRSILYLYQKPIEIEKMVLQETEIESVIWMEYHEVLKAIRENTIPHCIYEDEFIKVGKALGISCI